MGRPHASTKRFCCRGHDTVVTGRYDNYSCKECCRERKAALRKGRTPKRTCKNGHDTSVLGRYNNGACRACCAMYKRNTRRRQALGLNMVRAARVRRLFQSQSDASKKWAYRFEVTARSGDRHAHDLFFENWIDILEADDWCVAAGENLSSVYPELYMGAA